MRGKGYPKTGNSWSESQRLEKSRMFEDCRDDSVIGGNDQGVRRSCYEMMLEIKTDRFINLSTHLSIEINLWWMKKPLFKDSPSKP